MASINQFTNSILNTDLKTARIPRRNDPVAPQMTPLPANYSVTSNVGATNPAKPTTKPVAKPVVASTAPTSLPPAGQQYISALTTPPAQTNTNTSSAGVTAPTTDVAKPKTAYDKYLESLNSEDTLRALKQKKSDATRLAEIQNQGDRASYEARKGYQANLDRSGGLRSGAEQAAQVYNRRASDDLADLALQEGAAARTAGVSRDAYNDAIASGKTIYEAEKAQEEADLANTRYTDETKYSREQDKIGQDFEMKKFEEDKRQFGLQYALAQQKANEPKALTAAQEAKQIADQEKEDAAQQSASTSIGLVNNLLKDSRYKSVSGAVQTGSIPFIGDRAAVNEYNQLQGLLKLGIRGLLKGQGAVSDYEGKILSESASSLSRLTSESQAEEALKKIRGVLKTNNGQITTVVVTSPEGETIEADLSGPEIYQLTNEGNTIKYK